MRIVKISIIKIIIFLCIIFISLSGCEDTSKASQEPCPFPPAESNFPVFPEPSAFCKECFFNIEFLEQEYTFEGNQLEISWTGLSEAHNSFFSFYFAPPSTLDDLYNNIGVSMPFLQLYTLLSSNSDSNFSAGTTELGIYNYCKDLFEPITGDVNQSYHQITQVELIESYPVEIDSIQHKLSIFYFYGELTMTFIVNDEVKEAKANYKLLGSIEEKI